MLLTVVCQLVVVAAGACGSGAPQRLGPQGGADAAVVPRSEAAA